MIEVRDAPITALVRLSFDEIFVNGGFVPDPAFGTLGKYLRFPVIVRRSAMIGIRALCRPQIGGNQRRLPGSARFTSKGRK